MNYDCPDCKSQNTQKVEIAYQTGKSDFSGTQKGKSLELSMGDGLGVSGSKGSFSGTQQSLFSKSIEPPQPKTGLLTASIIFIIFGVILILIGSSTTAINLAIGIGVLFYLLHKIFNPSKEEYNKEMELYKKKFICLRCGNIFIPKED